MMVLYNASFYLFVIILLFNRCFKSCSSTLTEYTKNYTYDNSNQPQIRIPNGKIQGIHMTSRNGRKISAFTGIPYAQSPVGNLRFKNPVPAAAWIDILDGSLDSKKCPQTNGKMLFGDEDCLQVNVYTPQLPTSKNRTLLPVMVYVYGGLFKKGSNSFTRWQPHFILDKDVVLVVPNYRLGILGFFSTGDEISPGNYGLKDLVLALKWNRDNIRYFGGDPDRVTLVGGSSGGLCIQLLTLTNATNGLFHRYITESGSALSFIAQQPQTTLKSYAIQLGEHFRCPTNTSSLLVNCLRGLDALQLVDTESIYYKWDIFPQAAWGPTVEPKIEGALLTDTATNLYATKKIPNLPHLCSIVKDEGTIYNSWLHNKPETFQNFLDNIDLALPHMLNYKYKVQNVTEYTNALKSYYLNDLTVDKDVLWVNVSKLAGDVSFTYPTYTEIRKKLHHVNSPVYFCSFEYRGTFSYGYSYVKNFVEDWGIAHGDELIYLFIGPNPAYAPPGYTFTKSDWTMLDSMVQLWTSFVTNGIPTISDSNNTLIWEPYSTRDNYLQIGNDTDPILTIKYNFLPERMQFLEELDAVTTWL